MRNKGSRYEMRSGLIWGEGRSNGAQTCHIQNQGRSYIMRTALIWKERRSNGVRTGLKWGGGLLNEARPYMEG